MENLVNQLFWLWAPLTFIPEWLRIGIVTVVVFLLARPVIFFIVPKLIIGIVLVLMLILRIFSIPIMKVLNIFEGRNGHTPFWVDSTLELLSKSEEGLQSLNELAKKKVGNIRIIKKWTFRIAILTAVLLSLAITNGPTEIYAVKWKEFDTWMTQEKLQNELGFNSAEFVASFESESEAEEIDGNGMKLTLNDSYKNGGFIRAEPSLQAKEIDDMVWGEVVTYLDEQSVDGEGRTWVKVTTEEGVTGWVSAKILREN